MAERSELSRAELSCGTVLNRTVSEIYGEVSLS